MSADLASEQGGKASMAEHGSSAQAGLLSRHSLLHKREILCPTFLDPVFGLRIETFIWTYIQLREYSAVYTMSDMEI